MKIVITSRDFKITDGIRDYIEKKIERFEKILQPNEKVDVSIKSEKSYKIIQIITKYNGEDIIISEKDEDLYLAIDMVDNKLKNLLEKKKEIRKAHKSREGFVNYFAKNEEVKGEKKMHKIVKRKVFDMKPMSEDEAILQMEALGHKSYMFLNSDAFTMCLLYKRNDGDYGYIETVE